MNAPKIFIYSSREAVGSAVARHVAKIISQRPRVVLGLPTGSSPIGIYKEIVRMYRAGDIDFAGVTAFNLDEYYPMQPDAPQSYHRFMREHLFDHVNCTAFHVPDGKPRSGERIVQDCSAYEELIGETGGIDFQILGIGRNGHIGFNEPGSRRDSVTRLLTLDPMTRTDAAQDFGGLQNVPQQAISMGIGTVMQSREIILVASGPAKASVIRQAFLGPISSDVPATFLREHPNTQFWLDEAAASEIIGENGLEIERAG